MSVATIKKNDTVIAIAGVSLGKTGKVLQVIPGSNRAVVEGLSMMKKTMRKSEDNPQGGIVEKERSIPVSNLMLFCPDCKKGVRINRVREADKSARKCRGCSHIFDA